MTPQDLIEPKFDVSAIELPAEGSDYLFVADHGGARAITIEVVPQNAPCWSASFAGPEPGIRALTALLRTPAPTGLCVVERGTAFLGDVLNPEGFGVLKTPGPVIAAQELVDEGLLLLLTSWGIVAIDTLGMCWATQRIAIDGFQITESDGVYISGIADPNDDQPHPFAVELSTGRLLGGAGIV